MGEMICSGADVTGRHGALKGSFPSRPHGRCGTEFRSAQSAGGWLVVGPRLEDLARVPARSPMTRCHPARGAAVAHS
jgi:hypothetical protein